MMGGSLVIATHNTHKTEEIAAMLGSLFTDIRDLTSFPEIPPADETGATFLENASIKALEASRVKSGVYFLSDDSGLEVDALNGAPGVYSARFAGENATDADNRNKLLADLKDAENRSARFRCVLVLAKDGEVLLHAAGTVEGQITHQERGEGGFGYDRIFVPDGYDQTFGELPASTKNSLSHRANALADLKSKIG